MKTFRKRGREGAVFKELRKNSLVIKGWGQSEQVRVEWRVQQSRGASWTWIQSGIVFSYKCKPPFLDWSLSSSERPPLSLPAHNFSFYSHVPTSPLPRIHMPWAVIPSSGKRFLSGWTGAEWCHLSSLGFMLLIWKWKAKDNSKRVLLECNSLIYS